MGNASDLLFKIIGFLFIIVGAIFSFGAKSFVEKYKLDEKLKIDIDTEMDEEEIQKYKVQKAVLNLKMLGMVVALPGIIIILIVFK